MKLRLLLFTVLILSLGYNASSQNKKLDKALGKIKKSYATGDFPSATAALKKFKPEAEKQGVPNPYLIEYYLMDVKISHATGMLMTLDDNIQKLLDFSRELYGETSSSYPEILIEVSELYLEYGNYRLALDYLTKAEQLLKKAEKMNEALDARITVARAEAMIGQGFINKAIQLLQEVETYYEKRAVDKEAVVEKDQIKTVRLNEQEIFKRYNEYARIKTLYLYAYAKKGRIAIPGANEDNADVEVAGNAIDGWMKGRRRFLGETSLAEVAYKYYWAKALVDNGNQTLPNFLEFDKILGELKRKTSPTNTLAHQIYLAYLKDLLKKQLLSRYQNTKLEYEKIIDKFYPKTSIHKMKIKAVEFNSKLAKEQTKDLENQALALLNSKVLPKNYSTRVQVLQFLVDIAISERRLVNAESYLNQLTEIRKELCGENAPDYHLARIQLANFYLDYTNKIEEAGKIYEESFFKIVEKEIGEQHEDLINIYNHIAQWYELTDRYAQASRMLQKARDAAQYKYSNDDILFGVEHDNIGRLELKIGQFEAAEADIKRAVEVIDLKKNRDYVEYDAAYASALQTEAKLLGIKGLFSDAESKLKEAKSIAKKSGQNAGDQLSATKELSSLYIQLGQYSETERLLDQLLVEYEKLYGATSLRLLEPLVDKGRILLLKGDYTEAQKVATRANKLAVTVYGENSTKTAPSQKLLSDIYYTLGDLDKAQEFVLKALASQEKQFGRNHIEVAKSISQLALIKFYKGDNRKEVEQLMIESRDIMAEKLGKDNPSYAEILKNVAVLYISEKKYDIAFNSLTVAEGIWRSKTGTKDNINAASIYVLTGDVYYQLKSYKKAEEFYIKAQELYRNSDAFSKTHPEYVKVLSKLSKVYYMEKQFKSSKNLIEEALDNYENFIKQYFPALSEREKAKYWNTIKADFEFYNTLAFSNREDFRDLTGKVYNYQLLTKALLLSSSIKIRERIMNSTDEELKKQFKNWVEKKEMLSLALSMSASQLAENRIDPIALNQEVERLEKELSQKSELFGQTLDNKKITYDDVRKSLRENEVALEMVRYRYFDHTFTDSVIYAALYIKPEQKQPKAIILGDGKKMETRYFKYYRNAITSKVHDEYSYNVYWKPIINELGVASTVFLSADGVYNQINLESVPTPDGRYIIDNANIVLVSNTKDIYLRKVKYRPSAQYNTAAMFGNPLFYTASADETKLIPQLPGTEREISQLQFSFREKGWVTSQFIDKQATEEKLKELKDQKVVHIATHGLYRPSAEITMENALEGNEALLAQNPLMRTGLLFRGAGDLLDKTSVNYNLENGILTADEAMSLNLDRTDLVVLSACETGLGDLEAGEGVYGLQRAFLVAGAKVLVMSMFKVDDEATQKLMLKFYQKWFITKNMRQSMIEAKKELRNEFPDPIFWGAFMMIGLE